MTEIQDKITYTINQIHDLEHTLIGLRKLDRDCRDIGEIKGMLAKMGISEHSYSICQNSDSVKVVLNGELILISCHVNVDWNTSSYAINNTQVIYFRKKK